LAHGNGREHFEIEVWANTAPAALDAQAHPNLESLEKIEESLQERNDR